MRILLTGSTGYVGNIIKTHLERKYDIFCTSTRCVAGEKQAPCDLTDRAAVFGLAKRVSPDVVIHAAGNKDIEFCERNTAAAFSVNCDSVRNVCEAFADARIIYLSTDYVFDGTRGHYEEHDQPRPLTVYGKSKLCGEVDGKKIAGRRLVILRVSALYDQNAAFLRFLQEKLSSGEPVECFFDSFYSPTYFRDFLYVLEQLLVTACNDEGVFHACGQSMSRYEFAKAFALACEFDASLIRKQSYHERTTFLFNDLSLDNVRTRRLLGACTTNVMDALREIGRTIRT